MRKIISIVLTLGVILGLTAFAAPVAAAPCTCPTGSTPLVITDLLVPVPNPVPFCAGQVSHYSIAGGLTPQTLLADTDKLSVDFPADTDLSSVLVGDVLINGAAPAAITVNGQHLEFVIPIAAFGVTVIPMGSAITITVNNVLNPTVDDTYCLYIDFCDDAICTSIQFDCGTYAVSPVTKDLGCHFDFSPDYAGLAEDFVPPFKACGDAVYGTFVGGVGYVTSFNYILRDENGGCNNPCTTLSQFWFEVTKVATGGSIYLDDSLVIHPALTAADIGTKYSLMAAFVWPPPDVLIPMQIHFDTPGDYEIKFFAECPAVGCPTCAGPTVIMECTLAATVYQYLDAWKVPLEEKWNLISLPLFPYDTSIASVLGTVDRKDQLKSVWYFDQCEDPDAYEGVWHSAAYDVATDTFSGDLTDIQTGKAYWVRTLHATEAGYVAGPNGFWVFGTSSIMPDPTGVDMGYFNVCEGWNMVGFKAPWVAGVPIAQIDNTFVPGGYLWNFNFGPFDVKYGMIYDWNPVPVPGFWTTWIPGTLMMQPGEGYWIPFDGDDAISPPA